MTQSNWVPYYDRKPLKINGDPSDKDEVYIQKKNSTYVYRNKNDKNCGQCLAFHKGLPCEGKTRCIYK